jgi:hypothetical protein
MDICRRQYDAAEVPEDACRVRLDRNNNWCSLGISELKPGEGTKMNSLAVFIGSSIQGMTPKYLRKTGLKDWLVRRVEAFDFGCVAIVATDKRGVFLVY